jgi:hypothetical protein
MWSFAFKKAHKLEVFGPKNNEVGEEKRVLHKQKPLSMQVRNSTYCEDGGHDTPLVRRHKECVYTQF